MELMGRMGMGAVAVQSQDLVLGLDTLLELGEQNHLNLICANLVDADGKPLLPGYKVFDYGGKRLGVLAVTDPRMQHLIQKLPPDVAFGEPGPALAEGVRALREDEHCDAVVLLYGGRREQTLEACKEQAGIDLVFFGNASISQRVAAETELGAQVFTAANRGKDFGEIMLTMKDDGDVELSPILIHELDKTYEQDPDLKQIVDGFKAELAERKQRADLIQKLAKDYSETPVADTFLGSETCARCHQAEYDSFMETAHAHALATLEKDFQESNPECVGCHVTGWQTPGGYGLDARNRGMLANVQCEACHGYGTAHERGVETTRAAAEAMCLQCHDADNSPEFDYAAYWEKIKH